MLRCESKTTPHIGYNRRAKGFTCWTQLVAMLFCHLGRAGSLREICNGLACCVGKLIHVGIGRAPKRSSLSYANAHRPAALFEDLFWKLATRLRNRKGLGQRKSKFRFKNKLLSLDSRTISLCLSMLPWARFRRAKGSPIASFAAGIWIAAKRVDAKRADRILKNDVSGTFRRAFPSGKQEAH